MKDITIKNLVLSLIAPVALAIYSVAFLFLNNIDEVAAKDIITPLSISLLSIVILLLGFSIILKDFYRSGILSGAFYILLLNYKNIEDAVRTFSYRIRYWHVFPTILLLFGIAAYLLYRFMSEDMAKQFSGIFALVFVVLIAINVVTNINGVVRKIIGTQVVTPIQAENSEVIPGQPNVYYIILDEYSNFDILEKYYGDNNREFYDFLVEHAFTISEHSQNEIMNLYTLYITTNYLNLDYVSIGSEPDAIATAQSLRINPSLFQQFNRRGYEIKFYAGGIPIRWGDSYGAQSEEARTAMTMDGKNFSQLFFSNTFLYPFITVTDDDKIRQSTLNSFDFILNNISDGDQSRFIYAHTPGAHEAFVFGENGEKIPVSERENFADPQYYLGQYKFVTKLTMNVITQIIDKDPNGVIIIMSDHSMRKTQDISGKVLVTDEDKTTIFNAVYFRGEPIEEINNHSGVNTLRLVLDRLFGSDFGVVEVPVK